jgi:cytochrome o ubiquinol oxidase subunit I
MVAAAMAICILSFVVWLHHFFTMGAGANVNGFFGVMTMIIAVPTGVKIYNWLFTMFGGRVRFTVPTLWSIGFMVTFVIGGMTGVLLAVPPADFQLHNSVFLIAHFHNVIIGGVFFGAMAGYNYWFPKAFGFTLEGRWGKAAFWCWFIGFYLAFMPLYALGLMGMTRRMQHYDDPQQQPLLIVAAIGAAVILAGIASIAVQLVVSIRTRERRRDRTGDPWDGRTLEWSTPSPPPPWNFPGGAAFLGLELRAFAGMVARGATLERSAFLSAFFTLVGCHGLHVTVGLLWLMVMIAQVATKGFPAFVCRRLLCFSLFWHALDIIWVGIFTVVYLIGIRG